jgi:hypothetical protein
VDVPPPRHGDFVGISICNFPLWPSDADRKVPMLSRWHMQEQHSSARGIDRLQLVFLELPKLDRSREPTTLVEKWAYFFQHAPYLERIPAALATEPSLVGAFEAARLAAFTKAERDEYTAELIAIQDHIGLETGALKRGRSEGKREGLRLGIEAACKVLQIPLDAARRAQLDGLDDGGLEALLDRISTRRAWE